MKNLRSRNAPRLFERTMELLKTIRMLMYSTARKKVLSKPSFASIRSCLRRSIFGWTPVVRESAMSRRMRTKLTRTVVATNKSIPGKISLELSSSATCPLWSVRKN